MHTGTGCCRLLITFHYYNYFIVWMLWVSHFKMLILDVIFLCIEGNLSIPYNFIFVLSYICKTTLHTVVFMTQALFNHLFFRESLQDYLQYGVSLQGNCMRMLWSCCSHVDTDIVQEEIPSPHEKIMQYLCVCSSLSNTVCSYRAT